MLFASVCTLSIACAAPVAVSTPVTPGRTSLAADLRSARAQGESAEGTSKQGPSATSARPASFGGTLRYVALGDSYTIGEGVRTRERWPNQLVHMLGPAWGLDLIANFAFTGATTADVIDEQLDEMANLDPGFVSLLIGVNDVVQGVPIEQYLRNLRTILRRVLETVPRNRMIMVTIPDYTLTPQGPLYGGRSAAARVEAFNTAMLQEASVEGISCVDITPMSDMVSGDESFVADDGLHPSAKQYAGWVELIVPKVRQLLSAAPQSRSTQ